MPSSPCRVADWGLVAVCDQEGSPTGIFTDGDLRRAFERHLDLQSAFIGDAMSPDPHSIGPDRLAVEAVEMMERLRINALLVVDDHGKLAGALNMHDLFTAKVDARRVADRLEQVAL